MAAPFGPNAFQQLLRIFVVPTLSLGKIRLGRHQLPLARRLQHTGAR